MEKRSFLKTLAAATAMGMVSTNKLFALTESNKKKENKTLPQNDREYWCNLLYKISAPVLSALSKGELRKSMELELSPIWNNGDPNVGYLECFGRLIGGLAPWLSLPDDLTKEGKQRKELKEWALQSFAHSVNPNSPDYMSWQSGPQPLVDAAYFSNALMRAPKQLWEPLDNITKQRIIKELKGLRRVQPAYSNWLLFAAMNEAFLLSIGEEYDPMRLDLTIKKTNEWYVGDGWYSDGPKYHFDYYNSYVMHPMLVEVMEVMDKKGKLKPNLYEQAVKRCQRYSEYLERMISPEGTYPPFGRSLTYRTAAFQALALMAWRKKLPEGVSEGQTRAALTAVHKSIFENPTNFDNKGFLTLGFAGHQPELADYYSNSGSMYITSESFLPLGLPATDSFWTAKEEPWTAKKAFVNSRFKKDYAVEY